MNIQVVHTGPYLRSIGMDIERGRFPRTLKPVHTGPYLHHTYVRARARVNHENRYGPVWTGRKENVGRRQNPSIPMDHRYGPGVDRVQS